MTDQERWHKAAHAMQSGVATEMAYNPSASAIQPKHLRVGINTALTDHGSLVKLLIDKGIITEIEYLKAIADGMEAEAQRYEEKLTQVLGYKVTLG